ncbi:MAG: hypothetical protein ACYDH6_11230 [Acidimicrobiales bacterium]
MLTDAAAAIAVPRAAPANSFVLHAPLELLARAILLPHVAVSRRGDARDRLTDLVASYEASGDPVETPKPLARSVEELAAALITAIAAGDLDDVDRYALALGESATPAQLRRLLGPAIVHSLAAAGHASILLHLLPRVEVPGTLLRGPARELARNPGWHIEWLDRPCGRTAGAPRLDLDEAIALVPTLGTPGSDFIYPLVSQVDGSGVASKVLADALDVDVRDAARRLSRVAAWSMLHEPGDHAPYGWTHCLTIPQAVIGLPVADRTAVGVAATYVVAFRAALAKRALVRAYEPRPQRGDIADAMAEGPVAAASAAWHAADTAALVCHLATHASLHGDAHYVKYTLACLDAAAADPGAGRLYLAAAASLAGWWATSTRA